MNIPRDKLYHFGAGAAVALAVQAGCLLFVGAVVPAVGTAAAALAGWAKEDWDARQNIAAARKGLPAPHSVEVADRNSTAGGGLVVDLVTFLVNFLLSA